MNSKTLVTSLVFLFVGSLSAAAADVPFETALNAIIESHVGLGSQRAQIDSARAQRLGARATFLPQLELSATHLNNHIHFNDPLLITRSLNATASLNVFRFGADLAGLSAADARLEEQISRLTTAELKAEADGVEALVSWFERLSQVRVAESRVEQSREFATIAKTRYSRGVLPQEEVDKVSIDLANAEAGLQNAQSLLHVARGNVESLIHARFGITPERISLEWPWKDKFTTENVKRWLAETPQAELGPTYASERAALRAEEALVRRSYRSIFPTLDLSYSWRKLELDPGTRTDAREAMVVLSLPLFEGFSDYAAYRAQTAKATASRYVFEQAVREVPATQGVAQKNFTIAYETALAREKNLLVARRLLTSGTQRFQIGRARADELSLDQSRVNEAELLAVEGWANAHRALMRLLHSFGQSVRGI